MWLYRSLSPRALETVCQNLAVIVSTGVFWEAHTSDELLVVPWEKPATGLLCSLPPPPPPQKEHSTPKIIESAHIKCVKISHNDKPSFWKCRHGNTFLYATDQKVLNILLIIDAEYKSCQDEASWMALRGASAQKNFTLWIDPDGRGPLAPFEVECMRDSSGKYDTVVHHDRESSTAVPRGYEDPGSYKANLTYGGASVSQIIALVDASTSCKQFIYFACHHVVMTSSGQSYAYWVNRAGKPMLHWGGGIPGQLSCACYVTKSCARNKRCNCDANDSTWRYDSGYLTQKRNLPVTEVRAGDNGHSKEHARFYVGPLICTSWSCSGSRTLAYQNTCASTLPHVVIAFEHFLWWSAPFLGSSPNMLSKVSVLFLFFFCVVMLWKCCHKFSWAARSSNTCKLNNTPCHLSPKASPFCLSRILFFFFNMAYAFQPPVTSAHAPATCMHIRRTIAQSHHKP